MGVDKITGLLERIAVATERGADALERLESRGAQTPEQVQESIRAALSTIGENPIFDGVFGALSLTKSHTRVGGGGS